MEEKNGLGATNGTLLQLVTFRIADEEYGVDISAVREINKMVQITRLPNSPDFVEGIINLRGHVIPVIDLRKRLGLEKLDRDKDTSIVVIDISGNTFGFLVDEVKEVLRIPQSITEPPPELGTIDHPNYVTSVAKLDDHLLFLLDVQKLTTFDEGLTELQAN